MLTRVVTHADSGACVCGGGTPCIVQALSRSGTRCAAPAESGEVFFCRRQLVVSGIISFVCFGQGGPWLTVVDL